jgi:hypothetical protein
MAQFSIGQQIEAREAKLSLDRARELLSYDAETGRLTWLVSRGSKRAGSAAGFVDPAGYLIVRVDRVFYLGHRLGWFLHHGRWPDGFIDHRNTKTNRLSNLREASASQNQGNSKRSKNNSSGFKGVSRARRDKCWRAQITVNYKTKFLGHFKTAEVAHRAYIDASILAFGQFARAK